ncbi:MAG: hypothetical protein GF401_10265 [Chitinivibrionales bacterium]|nr:hypothetical protein [Chitinivibrionales bacterium]
MKCLSLKTILFWTAFLSIGVFAQGPIVIIGDLELSRDEIAQKLDNANQDPMLAVIKIKRAEAIKRLTQIRKLPGGNGEKQVYQDVFGASFDDDNIAINDPALPHAAKKDALLRKSLFERWLTEMAEKIVSVTFVDEKAFWELVQNSESYRIRKENGYEPSMDTWVYTCHELLVSPDKVIAEKNGACFLNGSELNVWIENNYTGSVMPYAKRKHTREEILDILAEKATEGKLLSEQAGEGKIEIKQNVRERAIDKFVRDNMMHAGLKIGTIKGKSLSEASEMIYENYFKRKGAGIARLRNILDGSTKVTSFEGPEAVYLANAATGSMQQDIIEGVGDDELYEWMKSSGFKGNFHEARQVFGAQRYDEYIDSEIKNAGIAILSFTKKK